MRLGEGEKLIEDRVIVALDVASRAEAERLCGILSGRVRMLKVGLQLFISEGPPIVADIRDAGFDVFLDLKLHDIPHQVGLACAEIVDIGAAMFTVHVAGGSQMLRAAVDATHGAARGREVPAPKIVGVTVLTSLDEANLRDLGVQRRLEDQVSGLTRLALDSGLDGVVASPREVARLRREFGPGFVVVAPGIRPLHSGGDDQKRTTSPAEALAAGASYLVVGRPVTAAPDPASALASLVEELQ